ncbi:unnamed protein product [Toxocara canis]|uniref:LITAF domain-containing protein n=1 Tax=Toxocara canis TaxID=6265 RepID=A0A183UMI8_TOXCA|nr:unnamed protein product [Toxocara canis]
MDQNEIGGVVVPYQQQPGPMSFAMPPPLWYPSAPKPMTIGLYMGPPVNIPYPQYAIPVVKRTEKKKPDSACSQICCGGVAQLLWTIIAIVIMGMLAALVLALVVI